MKPKTRSAVIKLAIHHANNVGAVMTIMSRREALASAPWPEDGAPAWESEFRRAYADRLEARGIARPAVHGGKSSKGGPGGKTELCALRVYMTPEELDAAKAMAKAGRTPLSVSAWARRLIAKAIP